MIVFTNGCFDLLHYGHFNLLGHCYRLSNNDEYSTNNRVIVGLDSDRKIKQDKGKYPIFSWEERKFALLELTNSEECGLVDQVVQFSTNEELRDLVKLIRPDVLLKGSEWKGNIVGEEFAKSIVLYPTPDIKMSSSMIADRVIERYLDNMSDYFHTGSIE